ncbi:hypothetical protein NM208_g6373 [Fusarium decemcellulare]|uniref:Uncharacterized protein n=1 Tax=Fusarium decemcellulare TaxID=57161 RepID=A0ACC1SDJ5_9HYPO|nr:hypothetical protein NM208_g6373 [Fusarium decemcellulare]
MQPNPTYHMEIETLQDAENIVAECLSRQLPLVHRGPNDQEAHRITRNNAVFVFRDSGRSLDPHGPQPDLTSRVIRDANGSRRNNLRRKSVVIRMGGQEFRVEVVYRLTIGVPDNAQFVQHRRRHNTIASFDSNVADFRARLLTTTGVSIERAQGNSNVFQSKQGAESSQDHLVTDSPDDLQRNLIYRKVQLAVIGVSIDTTLFLGIGGFLVGAGSASLLLVSVHDTFWP